MKRFEAICLVVAIIFFSFTPLISAYSDYCTPPDDAIVMIDHQGDWYNITLTDAMCVQTSIGIECSPDIPVADFTATPREGETPLQVHFTDLSNTGGCPDAWLWVFGDGGTSAIQNPDYTYWTGGNFTVSLAVYNFTGGTDIKVIPLYINVSDARTPTPTPTARPTGSSSLSSSGRANVGETWIRFQWTNPEDNSTVNVYTDGTLNSTNTTFNYAYLQGLEPLEEHNVQVYNSSNTSELLYSSTVMTIYPLWNIALLIVGILGLIVLLLVLKDPYKIILAGATAISLAIYTSSISAGHGGLYIIPLILAVAVGVIMAINFVQVIRGNVQW